MRHFADAEERFARTERMRLAEAAYPFDVRRLQNRKHLMAARLENRLRYRGHGNHL
jgi:hypothetical protein